MKQPTRPENRRNWKAVTFPYEIIHEYEFRECLYCLTDAQVDVLMGIVEPLAWDTRWFTVGETTIDPEWIEQFRNDIQRRLKVPCGCENIIYRYTSDGVLQQSDDDGETWTDAPQSDPRNNSLQFPPVPGDDGDQKKCDAARGMADLIKEQVGDQLTDDMARYTLQELINDWVGTILNTGGNIFEALIVIATNQIFALSIAILRPALTTEVYDQLMCIFIENMADDASFTTEQWEDTRTQILSDITGIAGIFLEHLIYLLGAVGLTNLARSQAAQDAECNCGDNIPVYLPTNGLGTYVSDDGINFIFDSGAGACGGGHCVHLQFEPGQLFLASATCGRLTATPVTGDWDHSFSVYYPCGSNDGLTPGLTPYYDLSTHAWVLTSTTAFRVSCSATPP